MTMLVTMTTMMMTMMMMMTTEQTVGIHIITATILVTFKRHQS